MSPGEQSWSEYTHVSYENTDAVIARLTAIEDAWTAIRLATGLLLGVPAFPRPRSLQRFRERRVSALVKHAWRSVPFYSRRYRDAGVDPAAVRGLADLARLPTVGKSDLQNAEPSDLLSRDHPADGLIERRTTGSSGLPLVIRRTWFEERLLGLFRWRALAALGWKATDLHLDIEEPVALHPRDRLWAHQLAKRIGRFRQTRVSAFESPQTLLATLSRERPEVVTSYSGALAGMARRALDANPRTHRPRLIVGHSDTITEAMRQVVSDAFGQSLREFYDANEANVMAFECPDGGALHVVDDSVVLEVLVGDRPARPNERGEVVLTSLRSFAMPFIRYRMGDLVIQGEGQCQCGSPFSTVHSVVGRMFDLFPLPGGGAIHPYEIINMLGREAPWIREFRVVQERIDCVRVRFVSNEIPSAEQEASVLLALDRLLEIRAVGKPTDVPFDLSLDRVDRFEEPLTAKLRACRSLVSSSYSSVD